MSLDSTEKYEIPYIKKTDKLATETFNNILDDIDSKMLGTDHLSSIAHWSLWKPTTQYSKGDIVRYEGLGSSQYVQCVEAGFSGITKPTVNVTGTVFNDNTVSWLVKSLSDSDSSGGGISIWLSGAYYDKGQAVLYKGALYRCKVAHTSDVFADDHDTKWQEVASNIKNWQSSTYYNADDTAIYNNKLYKCITDHTSVSTFNYSNWVLVNDFYGAKDWAVNNQYTVGMLVMYEGGLYRCNTAHNSSSFSTDKSKWDLVCANISVWEDDTYYQSGYVVRYDGNLYVCNTEHTSGSTFDRNSWDLLCSQITIVDDWDSGVYYYENQLIKYQDVVYSCKLAHTSGSAFESDIAKWNVITKSVDVWETDKYYVEGIVVLNNRCLYRCISTHTSTTFEDDVDNWYKVSTVIDDWTYGKDYFVNDLIIFENDLYKCTTEHTSGDFERERENWQILCKSTATIFSWAENTYYYENQLVVYNGVIYRCTDAHKSTNDFAETVYLWSALTANLLTWTEDTYYTADTVVLYNNSLYKCITTHTSDTDFEQDRLEYWQLVANVPTILENWQQFTYYYEGQLSIIGSDIYQCIEAHMSSNTVDTIKWKKLGGTPSIGQWESDTDYQAGTLVMNGSDVYICISGHKSGEDFDNDLQYWHKIGEDDSGLKDYSEYDSYSVKANTIAKYNNSIIRCIEDVDTSTIEDSWEVVANADLVSWEDDTYYLVGQTVLNDGRLYRCTTAHTSGTTFDTTKWQLIKGVSSELEAQVATNKSNIELLMAKIDGIDKWVAGKAYAVDDVVIHDNHIYICITANSDNTFTPSKWTEISPDIKDLTPWETGKVYSINHIVFYNNKLYRCKTQHTSTNFPSDIANWDMIYANISTFANNTYYPVGSVVIYDKNLYRCINAHTSDTDNLHISQLYYGYKMLEFTYDGWSWKPAGFPPRAETITLANNYYVTTIHIVTGGGYSGILNFDVEVSSDNTTFTHVYNYDNPSAREGAVVDVPIYSNCKYIKMTVNSIKTMGPPYTNYGISMEHVYVYGDKNNWELLHNIKPSINDWVANTDYSVNDIVVYESNIYRCVADNRDNTFNTAHWQKLSKNGEKEIDIWYQNTLYKLNDIVLYQNRLYASTEEHTSESTFDNTKWKQLSQELVAWETVSAEESKVDNTDNKYISSIATIERTVTDSDLPKIVDLRINTSHGSCVDVLKKQEDGDLYSDTKLLEFKEHSNNFVETVSNISLNKTTKVDNIEFGEPVTLTNGNYVTSNEITLNDRVLGLDRDSIPRTIVVMHCEGRILPSGKVDPSTYIIDSSYVYEAYRSYNYSTIAGKFANSEQLAYIGAYSHVGTLENIPEFTIDFWFRTRDTYYKNPSNNYVNRWSIFDINVSYLFGLRCVDKDWYYDTRTGTVPAGGSVAESWLRGATYFGSTNINPTSDGKFHHYAITRKDGVIRVFLDGKLVGKFNFPASMSGNGSEIFRIASGARITSGSDVSYFFDELRFAIGCEWTENFTPPTKPYSFVGQPYTKYVYIKDNVAKAFINSTLTTISDDWANETITDSTFSNLDISSKLDLDTLKQLGTFKVVEYRTMKDYTNTPPNKINSLIDVEVLKTDLIDISNLESIDSLQLDCVVSNVTVNCFVTPNGTTYYKYQNNNWAVANPNTDTGNTITELNAISNFSAICNRDIGFAFRVTVNSETASMTMDKEMPITGMELSKWVSQIKGLTYRYGTDDNGLLRVVILESGQFKIKYPYSEVDISAIEGLTSELVEQISINKDNIDTLLAKADSIEKWQQEKEYSVDNVVVYNTAIYKCIEEHTSTSTFDITKWTNLSSHADEWKSATNYLIGDIVLYNNKIYTCIENHLSGSVFNVDKWAKDVYNDIKIEKIDDYIYSMKCGNLDYTNAYQYFLSINEIDLGACSSVRNGNYYGRNYDWQYDNMAEFIVKTPNINGRNKVIGLCALTTLTKDMVETEEWNDLYKVLPFAMLDGINEYGVVANVNVVPKDKGETTQTVPEIELRDTVCSSMLIRYILDNFDSAQSAVEYIRDYVAVYLPKRLHDMDYEVHIMVADSQKTYVLEFIDDSVVVLDVTSKPYMTNFYLSGVTFNNDGTVYTPATQDETHNAIDTNGITENGSGLERYNYIVANYNSANTLSGMKTLMNGLKYTNSYDTDHNPFWYTEFVGIPYGTNQRATVITDTEIYDDNIGDYIAEYETRTRNGNTWQTVHSIVYDISKKALYLIVQENGKEIVKYLDFEYKDKTETVPTVPIWSANTPYKQGQMLMNNEILYVVRTNHTSGSSFDNTNLIQIGITKEQAIAYSISL